MGKGKRPRKVPGECEGVANSQQKPATNPALAELVGANSRESNSIIDGKDSLQRSMNIEDILSFQEKLLDTFNNRRSAVDNRATVALTLSLALFGFIATQGNTIFSAFSKELRLSLSATLLLLIAGAVGHSIRLVAPLRRPRKVRRSQVRSLTWFYLIPNQSFEDYLSQVKDMSKEQVFDETARQVYDLSLLLRKRYDTLVWSFGYLDMALLFLVLAILINGVISL